MGSLNKVQLIGHLGRDAELKYTSAGAAVSKFSVATTEKWTDKSGQQQERTEWFTVDLWGKTAEALSEYLVKGKQLYVEGRLQTEEYTDKDGNKRKATKVRADKIVLLGGGGERRNDPRHIADEEVASGRPIVTDLDTEDSIPF